MAAKTGGGYGACCVTARLMHCCLASGCQQTLAEALVVKGRLPACGQMGGVGCRIL